MEPIRRDAYLGQLISRRENGLIKVITGIRRCGKSFLLFKLYYEYLLKDGVSEDNIIRISLDDDESEEYRNPKKLSLFIRERLKNNGRMHYVFIDEVQYAIRKEDLKSDGPLPLYSMLNGLMNLPNADVYVTGSNSRLLSKDVMTEFRGRGDEITVRPLSFREYYNYVGGDRADAYEEYALWGGLPFVLSKKDPRDKAKYLAGLFNEVYFRDIEERYNVNLPAVMRQLTDVLCSSTGSLTNPSKIAKTIKTSEQLDVNSQTIAVYLGYLEDSFLFSQARRFDVKGKKYFSFPSKYYCADTGLRNARLGFRQQEETHIMENVIYNELLARGYSVDVGVIETVAKGIDGKKHQTQCEIDFIAGDGMKRYYIQSALNIDDEGKERRELRPLLAAKDFFKKVIVTKTRSKPWIDESGILHAGVYDFLLDTSIID